METRTKRLAVTVTLTSSLALGRYDLRAQETAGDACLPGARLRGAAAQVLLADGACPAGHRDGPRHVGPADCPFGTLFEGEAPALFRDCLPARATDVLPATAMSCGHSPGFRTQRGPERGHGVFDTLIDRAFWETLRPGGLLYLPRCPRPECGARVEPCRSFYGRRAAAGTRSYFQSRVASRVLLRAAVDRARRVADPGTAHAVPVVAEAYRDDGEGPGGLQPTTFHGEVIVLDGENAALLADALRRVDHLGGGTSRGLGAVRVEVEDGAPESPLAGRLENFARGVSVRRSQYARLAPLSSASLEGAYFTIDLRSDALLRRHGWEPTVVLHADLLQSATGVGDPSLSLVRAYAEPGWRGGWHEAWGLPRPVELVARRGSCYLFRTNDLGAWTGALEALEWTGLGARTSEGYGDVRVCDPFHLVLREQAV